MASYTKTNYMDPMALVTPAIGLVFWTSVVFILLIFILKKFAWKPILDSVDKRNKNIELMQFGTYGICGVVYIVKKI